MIFLTRFRSYRYSYISTSLNNNGIKIFLIPEEVPVKSKTDTKGKTRTIYSEKAPIVLSS